MIDDASIESGLALTDITPELVEWYGNPEHRVVVRIEPFMGRYAEATLHPWMKPADIAEALERAASALDEGQQRPGGDRT